MRYRTPTLDEVAALIPEGETWWRQPHEMGAATLPGLPLPKPVAIPTSIPYVTALEIAASTSEKPDWLVPGFVALQAITEIDGAIKRSGKTTWITHLVAAVLDGGYFLGQPTRKTKVVYITEQQRGPFREALNRAGLIGRGDELRIVCRRDVAHMPWPELVAIVAADARRDGFGLLIVDTLAVLAGIREENDAGAAALAMQPLQDAAHDGLAVIVARHERKGGGVVGESARGSSAFAGDADIILQLRRPEGNQPSTRRVIESLSRYDETPEKIVVDLIDEGYVLLGDSEAVALADALRIVSAHIGGEFEQKEVDLDELAEEGDIPRATVRRAVRELKGPRESDRDQAVGSVVTRTASTP